MTRSEGTQEAERGSLPLSARLVGHWSLVSFEAVSGGHTEYPFGPDPVGDLIYDSTGRMAVQVMKRGRRLFASGEQEVGTLEELSAAVAGYAAYYGTFSVDEGAAVITHHVAASMFPNWVGTDQQRKVLLEDDRLTLSTPLESHGGERIFRIVWKRTE